MKAKLHFVLSITILFSSFYGFSQSSYWTKTTSTVQQSSRVFSGSNEVFELNEVKFRQAISKVGKGQYNVIQFPLLEGAFETFYVEEKSVFHPDLAKRYPQIKSFVGYNIERSMKVVFSLSHRGLQGMLLDYHGASKTFIEKQRGTANSYHVHKGSINRGGKSFECHTVDLGLAQAGVAKTQLFDDQILRKFRIAISASGSYSDHHGGGVADALAAINATLTRINEVFETDLGVTLELIPNNDLVIFTDAATDPYTGNLNAQVQSTLSSLIGEENYDVGILFNDDNDNGNAGFIGSVCIDNRKGSAFASALEPEGDQFDLDFVAHELGHQFGANHTWSFETEGTGVQVEPASGTTIMGYAGIVEGNDVAPFGDDYFHYVSVLQIN